MSPYLEMAKLHEKLIVKTRIGAHLHRFALLNAKLKCRICGNHVMVQDETIQFQGLCREEGERQRGKADLPTVCQKMSGSCVHAAPSQKNKSKVKMHIISEVKHQSFLLLLR